MHEAEVHKIIAAAVSRWRVLAPPAQPDKADGVDDLAVDIMVCLQVAGFEIQKRRK